MDWVDNFFRDADLKKIETLAPWFAEDVDLRFANAPPIHGKAAAVETMGAFYQTITAMKHVREELLVVGNTASQQAKVSYTALNGRVVTVPVSSYLRRNAEGRLDRLWIYIDIAPLYAAGA